MIKAVYPGTFDPLTRGHEDLVRRAATLFDKLVLAIADSKAKRPFFTLEERIAMAREVLGDMKNVEIVGFSTLLTEFVRKQGARVVLRGPCHRIRARAGRARGAARPARGVGLRVRVPARRPRSTTRAPCLRTNSVSRARAWCCAACARCRTSSTSSSSPA